MITRENLFGIVLSGNLFAIVMITLACVLIFIPMGVSVSMWNGQDAKVLKVEAYSGDHGVNYRIFTVQTTSGVAKVTAQCTYYDNATTIPVQDRLNWWWGVVDHFYVISPPSNVYGC